ncbi:AraC family transcriptional regulator [Trinickia mobilis]|uniref:AraC family transcriptional regulator n=1 Tax=Trinickia mobilis TaxID=2816356 RepID=UPI001A908BB2|nr:AraC family transcriptional regulator [Trinickia mobilis]
MTQHSPALHPVLDHLLAALDIGVANFTLCDIRDGWSVRFDACKTASLHYCMAGSGALVVQDGERITLDSNSFVMLPPGVCYRIESANSSLANTVDRERLGAWSSRETVPTVTVGECSEGVVTACGELDFDTGAGVDPFRAMSRPLVARFEGPSGLRDQFVLLLAECARPGLGSRVLVEALLKQCLVLVLRRQIDDGGTNLPWTAGIADQRLSRALEAIFERPQSALSVQRLADIAGMSRSSFAARFESTFGQPPMAMLKVVRLRKASELLATTTLQVSEVAKAVGFSSRSNFSQAFHKFHGMDPTTFRQWSKSKIAWAAPQRRVTV